MGAYIYNKYTYAQIRTCRWADRLRGHAHVDGEVSAPIHTCVRMYMYVYMRIYIYNTYAYANIHTHTGGLTD